MTHDDEPLDELAAAFRALPAPPPTRELSGEDATTRAVVAWMAQALESQGPARDGLAALQARRSAARRFAWRPLAAAALLLVLLGGPLWLLERAARAPDEAPTPPVVAAAPPDVSPMVVDAGPPAPLPPPPPAPAVAPAAPTLLAVASDRFEARSGPVHLLLVFDKPKSPAEESR